MPTVRGWMLRHALDDGLHGSPVQFFPPTGESADLFREVLVVPVDEAVAVTWTDDLGCERPTGFMSIAKPTEAS